MKCTNCNSPITKYSSYCSNCGMVIEKNEENNEKKENKENTNNKSIYFNVNTNNPKINSPKKSKNIAIIICAITTILIVSFIILFTFIIINEEDEDHYEDKFNTSEEIEEEATQDIEEVEYKDFVFKIPSELTSSSSEYQLTISDYKNGLISMVIYQEGKSFDSIRMMKNSIIDLLKVQGQAKDFDLTNAVTEEATYGNMDFVITSGLKQGSNYADIAYAGDENGVFIISLVKTQGEITENDRNEIYSVISTAYQLEGNQEII